MHKFQRPFSASIENLARIDEGSSPCLLSAKQHGRQGFACFYGESWPPPSFYIPARESSSRVAFPTALVSALTRMTSVPDFRTRLNQAL